MAASAFAETTIGLTAVGAVAQFAPVQATGAPAVAAGNAVGITTLAAASGVRMPIVVVGSAVAIAGAAIALGAAVEVHTTVTQVVTKAAGIAIGRALTAAAAAGDQVEVLILGN